MPVKPEQHAGIFEWLELVKDERRLKGGKRRYELLDYLVREEIEGRGENLKAYAIALDVLGRGADFDPTTDSIVRVEVARLRDALELYYARSTDPSEPEISIPKGSYRPTIKSAPPNDQVEQSTSPTASRKSGIFVSLAVGVVSLCGLVYFVLFASAPQLSEPGRPVVEIASITADQNSVGYSFAQGFRQQLLTDLAHLPTVTVRNGSLTVDDVRSAAASEPDYRLTITPAFEGQSGIVGLELSSLVTATVVWTRAIPIADSTSDFYTLLTEAVRGIGQEVAGSSGVITNEQATLALTAMMDRGSPRGEYQCLILSLVFDATKDRATEKLSRECLTDAIENGTQNSTLLALFALNEFFDSAGIPGEHGRPALETIRLLEDARLHALEAVDANPSDAFAHEVLGNILSALGDRDGAIERYQRAVDLAPSRPAPHFLLGWQMALQGNWDVGVDTMQEGIDMQPIIPGYMIIPLALDAFRQSDYEQSLQYAQAVIDRGDARGYSLAFAASLALGNTERAEEFFTDPSARTSTDPSDPMREVRVTFSNPDVMPRYQEVIEPFLSQLETQ